MIKVSVMYPNKPGARFNHEYYRNIHMPLVRTPMIAPTGMYENFPTIDANQAAEMVMQALLSRPPEVSTRLVS